MGVSVRVYKKKATTEDLVTLIETLGYGVREKWENESYGVKSTSVYLEKGEDVHFLFVVEYTEAFFKESDSERLNNELLDIETAGELTEVKREAIKDLQKGTDPVVTISGGTIHTEVLREIAKGIQGIIELNDCAELDNDNLEVYVSEEQTEEFKTRIKLVKAAEEIKRMSIEAAENMSKEEIEEITKELERILGRVK